MSRIDSLSRNSDMFTAIRRTKSLPVWLTLIAMLVIAATVVTVIVGSVSRSRHAVDNSADGSVLSSPEGAQSAGAGEAADTAKRAAAAASGSLSSASAAAGPIASQVSPATGAVAAAATDASAVAAATAGNADATSRDGLQTASPAHHEGPHSAASRAAARRATAMQAAHGDGSLRADIRRYNAERGAARHAQRLVPLQAASVPSGHSLWDEVPAPLSDLYRN